MDYGNHRNMDFTMGALQVSTSTQIIISYPVQGNLNFIVWKEIEYIQGEYGIDPDFQTRCIMWDNVQ